MIKIRHITELLEILPEEERIMVDILLSLIRNSLPAYCKEKISYNVPFFYGNRGICVVWPASVPRGGIKQGVLLGFWQGNKLNDSDNYLDKGSNKKVFYKVFKKAEDIDIQAIEKLLNEAVILDQRKN